MIAGAWVVDVPATSWVAGAPRVPPVAGPGVDPQVEPRPGHERGKFSRWTSSGEGSVLKVDCNRLSRLMRARDTYVPKYVTGFGYRAIKESIALVWDSG